MGIDILQLVSACQVGSSSKGSLIFEEEDVPMVIPLFRYAFDRCSPCSLFNPLFYGLTNFILDHPLRLLCLAPRCYLLHFSHYDVDCKAFAAIVR